jgi:hypothetical protein
MSPEIRFLRSQVGRILVYAHIFVKGHFPQKWPISKKWPFGTYLYNETEFEQTALPHMSTRSVQYTCQIWHESDRPDTRRWLEPAGYIIIC